MKIFIKYVIQVDVSSYLTYCSLVPIVLRNRDWTPVFNNINIKLSGNIPYSISKGLEITIQYNEGDVYLGYISKFDFDYDNFEWHIEVNHFLRKFEDYKISYEDLHDDLIEGTADFTNQVSFTVDTAGDYVNSASHGLSNGTRIQLRNDGGTLPTGLEANHNYYIYVRNSDSFYLFGNFADLATMDISEGDTSRKVNIQSAGTGTHYYTTDIDLNKYNDWGFFRDIQSLGWSSSSDQIFAIDPLKYVPADGNYHGHKPHFTLIGLHGSDVGSLPASSTRTYIAAKFEEDEGFVLYDSISNYLANNRMNFTSTGGGGNLKFAIIMRYGILSAAQDASNNVPYPTSFISIKWLVTKIFEKIGCTIDTTDIDNIVYHRISSDEWPWDKAVVMEQMLYNINQSTPVRPEQIIAGSDYEDAQISFFEFVQKIFGRLGIGIKYTGSYQYKLVSQKRDANWFITPENEDWFNIGHDFMVDFKEDKVSDENYGWQKSRYFGGQFLYYGPSALSFVYNDRDTYNYHMTEIYEKNKELNGLGNLTLQWWNHLMFFLINQGAGNNFVLDVADINLEVDEYGTRELYDAELSGNIYSIIQNEKNSVEKDWIIQEIECRANFLSQEIWSVKELYLDIKNRRIKIVQERTLN